MFKLTEIERGIMKMGRREFVFLSGVWGGMTDCPRKERN